MRKILYNRDSPEIQPLKKLIQTHQAAKETQNPYAQAAARAVGHAAATIHVETHALGVIFYGLTALTYKYNDTNFITQ